MFGEFNPPFNSVTHCPKLGLNSIVSILGAPGSGKTTQAKELANALSTVCILANESRNNHLRRSIADPSLGLLTTETAFLRFHLNFFKALGQCNFPNGVITDCAFQLDFAYAQIVLSTIQREQFNTIYAASINNKGKRKKNQIPKPNSIIVLTADPEELHRRIQARQTNQPHRLQWERNYTVEYLHRIQDGIREHLDQSGTNVLFIHQDSDMSVEQVTQLLLLQF